MKIQDFSVKKKVIKAIDSLLLKIPHFWEFKASICLKFGMRIALS